MRHVVRLAGILAGLLLATTPAGAGCTVEPIAQLDVTMRGLRPLITTKINGADATFLLDSGAFYSLISPGSADEYGLSRKSAPYGLVLQGVGGGADVDVVTVKSFGLAGASIPNVQFLVGGSEVGAVGLIGQNVLRLGDAEYDLSAGAVRLMRPHDCGRANLAYWAANGPVSVIDADPTTPGNPHTIGTVTLNDVKARAMFDTGADTTIVSLRAAARAGLKPGGPGMAPAGMSGGIGRRAIPVWIAAFASVKMGGEEVRNTHLQVGDLGPNIDMLVGADWFLSHRVYVANGQHRIYFTYNGGPIFLAAEHPAALRKTDGQGRPLALPAAAADPTDAEGFSRRGSARAAAGDLGGALADLDRAATLAPREPRYFFARASLYQQRKQPEQALADIDRVLALKPDHAEALMWRAAASEKKGDRDAALEDIDAASRALPKPSDLRLDLGSLYEGADSFDKAIEQYGVWITAHPVDRRKPQALNNRCFARALAGRDLQLAIADCDAALRLMPGAPAFLDSRGLARLRAGMLDKAIADYDAALKIAPKIEWSLYGRGIAKLRLGRKTEGEADIAAARAIDPAEIARAQHLGIVP